MPNRVTHIKARTNQESMYSMQVTKCYFGSLVFYLLLPLLLLLAGYEYMHLMVLLLCL